MPQTLKNLFSHNHELRPLFAKVQTLSALQRHFSAIAPDYLAQSTQILGLQHGQLSIAAANATIAAKLRQLAPELVILLQNRDCEVSGIRVKVQVSYAPPQVRHAPRKLSTTAKKTLQEFCSSLDESALKDAIEKMSNSKS